MQLSRSLLPAPVLILLLDVASPILASEHDPPTPGALAAIGVDGAIEDLPLRHTSVSIEVTAFVARTTVEQVFVNPFEHPIEAVYTFPLGHDAAVDEFEMQSGDRVIRGEVHRRAEARDIYEAARSEGRQAALLEQHRPNIFTQSVANLLPAGEVRVRLRTVETLNYEAGVYQLTFPLVVGPRYFPGDLLEEEAVVEEEVEEEELLDVGPEGGWIDAPDLRSGHDVEIRVTLDAGVPLSAVTSDSHAIEVEHEGPRRAQVTLGPADRIPNRDFILRWTVASDEPAIGVLTHREGVDGYFAFIVQPRGIVEAEQAAPKEILFVLDTSGSMSGDPLLLSQVFIRNALRSLGSRDTFNLIQFASGSSMFSKASLDATAENLEAAVTWVEQLHSDGGTEMLDGLERAIGHGSDDDRYRMIVLLTDGLIGNDDEILARVKKLPETVRVFTIGIGVTVNHSLLDSMASLGGGAYTFIANGKAAPTALERFRGWVIRPYLTDLEIDWGALPVGDWVPEIPRDLFSGQNLTVVGRYFGAAEGPIMVRGRLGGSYWEQEVPVTLPEVEPRHGALASVWARARIQELLDESPGKISPHNQEQVIDLALEHRLMSPFTSFVAVDYEVVNPGGDSEMILEPVPLPDGTSFDGTVSSGITVRVTDSNGPLPGATVTISHKTGGVATTTNLTDRDGEVDFPGLASGRGYRVDVSFPGFTAVRYDDLQVLSESGRVLAVQLTEELSERVEIVATTEVIDLAQTEQSTKFSQHFISDLPVPGRDYQNVLAMAAGVQDADGDGNPNVHGSRARDFQTVVNGVSNVDPATGQWISRINGNSIEEMEVITAGAGVEFGRAQGGFARIIQKQGSNTHEGVLHVDALGEDVVPISGHGERGGFDVSGPLVRDRLWYRASHGWVDRSDPVRAGQTLVALPQESASHSDMLTWQVSPRNKLQFHAQWQTDAARKVGVSSFVRSETTPRIERDERILSVGWTAPYSPKLLFESVLSRRDVGLERRPAGTATPNGCLAPEDPFLGSAECLDLVDGAQSGTAYRAIADKRRRYGLDSTATFYAGRKWGMTHELKLGVELGHERYDRSLARDPNLVRVIQEEEEIVLARTSPAPMSISVADSRNWALFVEDRFKPARQVALTVGLRLDSEHIEGDGYAPFDPRSELLRFIADADDLTGDERAAFAGSAFTGPEDLQAFLDGVASRVGEDHCCADPILGPEHVTAPRTPERMQLDDLNFAPFFSVKWFPWAAERAAFSFTARRYFDKLLPTYALVETEPATADLIVLGRGSAEPSVRPSIQILDRGLETPYQDEWTLKFEREIFAETRLSASLVRRSFERQIEHVDVNHLPGDFGRCVDQPAAVDGKLDDCDADGLPDLYVQSPLWGEVFLVGNFGSGTYEGFTLELDRRQYRSWEMRASYTLSEARGTAEAFDPLLGDERTLLENRTGFQSYDQRHVFKLHATVITPHAVRLGGSVAWESGLPYSTLEHRIVYDAIPPALAGLTESVPVPRLTYATSSRNSARNEPFINVDVRLAKDFPVGKGVVLRWRIDVLNALDDRSYFIYPGERAYGRSINGFDDATSRFGRRFQMGLEVAF